MKLDKQSAYEETVRLMISPDYFSFRWSWYRPILNRQEQAADRCSVDVRRLPVRMTGEGAREYIPYAVQPEMQDAIEVSLRRLRQYAIRYAIKGEKVSAHQLPKMDATVRAMVAYLRQQNPHLPRDLLHHWCADPKGATALLAVCEVLWQQGWQQDKADHAPWVPAINVLLLKMIRQSMAQLSDEYIDQTSHMMLCMTGGLYVWALQRFLKQYLKGTVEVAQIATYESMMLPATPMVFLQYQPDASLLGDDSRIIRAYGLEPEIVPRMRLLRAKVGMHNEGGMLQLLARDKLGAHLQRRTWARLSLWKLAMDSGFGGWMRYVLDAKRLDQLLAGQIQLDDASLDNLRENRDVPVAGWMLARMRSADAAQAVGELWLQDHITLMAFRVFEEDVRVEIARRRAETVWLDRKAYLRAQASAQLSTSGKSLRSGGLRNVAGNYAEEQSAKMLEQAWQNGELVLIQPDVSRALHSGRRIAQRQGCLKVEWSEYLARIHALHGSAAAEFTVQTFLPGVLTLLGDREDLFLDHCSASGCLLRGSVLTLAEAGVDLRRQLKHWLLAIFREHGVRMEEVGMPALAMCMDVASEWSFSELNDADSGSQRIAFSLAVPQVDAGVCRDSSVERLIRERDARQGLERPGQVHIEPVKTAEGRMLSLLHNSGFALTAAAMHELAEVLSRKVAVKRIQLTAQDMAAYRLPAAGLDVWMVERGDSDTWLLINAGTAMLAGVEMELFELLDGDGGAAKAILKRGTASGFAGV